MRWLAFFILAYLILGIQLGIGGHAQYRGVGPNLVLLAVVFISLNAPRDEALLGCFLLGAMQDLVTLQPMGLYAFSYGLVAMLISGLGLLANRSHPLTQFFMTLLGGSILGIVLLLHSRMHPLAPAVVENGTVLPALRIGPRVILISTVYTALLSPVVIGILQRTAGTFAFESNRRKTQY